MRSFIESIFSVISEAFSLEELMHEGEAILHNSSRDLSIFSIIKWFFSIFLLRVDIADFMELISKCIPSNLLHISADNLLSSSNISLSDSKIPPSRMTICFAVILHRFLCFNLYSLICVDCKKVIQISF